jgi:hypothetical protein
LGHHDVKFGYTKKNTKWKICSIKESFVAFTMRRHIITLLLKSRKDLTP